MDDVYISFAIIAKANVTRSSHTKLYSTTSESQHYVTILQLGLFEYWENKFTYKHTEKRSTNGSEASAYIYGHRQLNHTHTHIFTYTHTHLLNHIHSHTGSKKLPANPIRSTKCAYENKSN